MALSNWDTLAFNHQGKSTFGRFEGKKKNAIEIYKNWAYIHSPSMWVDGGSYCKPVIAQISEGSLILCDFEITAKRGPQNGIFIFARVFDSKPKKGKYTYFAGIGCSGYVDKIEEILAKLGRPQDYDENWCSGSSSGPNEPTIHYIENLETREHIVYWDENKKGKYDYGNDWVGVKKETLEEFFKWLDSLVESEYDTDMKKWIARCKKSKKFRYNQGNAFFTAHAGLGLEATEVGKARTPVIMKIIDGIPTKKGSK